MPGESSDRPITPMKDFVSNLSDENLWKDNFTVSIGYRDIDGSTTSPSAKETIYFYYDGWIWMKHWDATNKKFKDDVRLIEMPSILHCHHTMGTYEDEEGETIDVNKRIEKKPLNIRKVLYKNNPYLSWKSEFDLFDILDTVIFADDDFKVDDADRRYLMIWADITESPTELAEELGLSLIHI